MFEKLIKMVIFGCTAWAILTVGEMTVRATSSKLPVSTKSCVCGGLTTGNFGACAVYPETVSTKKQCQKYCNTFEPSNNGQPTCIPDLCTGYLGMPSCLEWCQTVDCITNGKSKRPKP